MTQPQPVAGGRYERDAKTGALTQLPDDESEIAPDAMPESALPADDPAQPQSVNPKKGGR